MHAASRAPRPAAPRRPAADFHAALADAVGSKTLPRAFMATRRSEWQHLKDKSLEEEAALLYARY